MTRMSLLGNCSIETALVLDGLLFMFLARVRNMAINREGEYVPSLYFSD